jgi:hypothetical protein
VQHTYPFALNRPLVASLQLRSLLVFVLSLGVWEGLRSLWWASCCAAGDIDPRKSQCSDDEMAQESVAALSITGFKWSGRVVF